MRTPSSGALPWAFLAGFPVTTRTFSPGASVKPGSIVPICRSRPLPRPTFTAHPAVENGFSPGFSTTNHSSFNVALDDAAWSSFTTSRMARSLPQSGSFSVVGPEDVTFAVVAFTAVFFVVDPLMAVPFFLSITAGESPERRRAIAGRAAFTALVIISTFAVAGGLIFKAFGISLGAFKVAGGLLLFLTSIDMMRAEPARTRSTQEEAAEAASESHGRDVAIVPMAVPMLAGPGAIATVMVLMSRAAWHPVRTTAVFVAIAVTFLVAWLLMRWATLAERWISRTVANALERVMGVLVAAIAVEFVVGGLRDLFPRLATS